MPLTDTRIRNLKASDKAFKLIDGRGLHLEVRPTGARLWRFRYRLGGKENVFAIGAYPEVSLSDARAARDEARKLVRQGLHPSHQRKSDRIRTAYENANTFAAVANEWIDGNGHWTPRTRRQRRNLLKADVFPHIGALPLRQVTTAHAHAIVKRIEARAPQMAVIARQCFTAISNLGMATMRSDIDLGFPLRRSVKLSPTVHKVPLRAHEIPAFFKTLETYPGSFQVRSAIRLLWWTLARPDEVISAAWVEFDLDNASWTVPKERMKMGQPHTFPLPSQAVELLRTWRAVGGASPFLVPNRQRPKHHASNGILIKAFTSMGYEGKFSPHGVRVTGRTILGEQGYPRDVLERQLAHREKKEVRAYDQGDRLDARRKMMQDWANYLDGLRTGANVTNIKASTG